MPQGFMHSCAAFFIPEIPMQRHQIKRETDIQIITGWIGEGQRVLDIGCGRGLVLEHLMRTRQARALGVDTDLAKVQSCVKRAVPVYHGEADALLAEFGNGFFENPGELICQSLRVARNVAVGFVNHGYWLNRIAVLRSGSRPVNEVFPHRWHEGRPYNPVTIRGFLDFARTEKVDVAEAVFLKGNWRDRTHILPNLTAGYAVFHLRSGGGRAG